MGKLVLKSIVKVAFGRYRFNRIYRLENGATHSPLPELPNNITCGRIDTTTLDVAEPRILERIRSYGGQDAHGFGLFLEGRLVSSCWFWGSQRFQDPLLWELKPGEVIMVDLITATGYRGRNFASMLIKYAGAAMQQAGHRRVYTWVWHSHYASYHAFEKAGWEQIAWVLEYRLPFWRRPRRLCWTPFVRLGAKTG